MPAKIKYLKTRSGHTVLSGTHVLLLFPGPRSIRRGLAAAGPRSADDTTAPLDADDPLLIPHLSRYDHRACNDKGNNLKTLGFSLGGIVFSAPTQRKAELWPKLMGNLKGLTNLYAHEITWMGDSFYFM